MSTIKLKSWIQNNIDKSEALKVVKRARFKGTSDDAARPYDVGEPVTLKGIAKKDAYFSGNVVYPEDFEKVMADVKAKKEVQVSAADALQSQNEVLAGKKNK